MGDIADAAQAEVEALAAAGLACRKPEGPGTTGECLWCGEPLAMGRRWCGAPCRDGWEAAQRWRGANHG